MTDTQFKKEQDAGLTPKREAFANAVAGGMTQADAYRHAFNAGKTTDKSVHELASRLMADIKVASRVAELRKPIAEKAQMTLESHLEDLQSLRDMAVKGKQYSAAISAEVSRGRAAGLYVERIQGPNKDGSFTVNAPWLTQQVQARNE
jgi:hypothetical protein